MKMRLCLFIAALFTFTITNAQRKLTAVKAGKVIDVVKGTVLTNQVILIDSNEIADIGSSLNIPHGAEAIEMADIYDDDYILSEYSKLGYPD